MRRRAAIGAWKRNGPKSARVGLAGFVLRGVLVVVPEARERVGRSEVGR
jgi:hypothetical protein